MISNLPVVITEQHELHFGNVCPRKIKLAFDERESFRMGMLLGGAWRFGMIWYDFIQFAQNTPSFFNLENFEITMKTVPMRFIKDCSLPIKYFSEIESITDLNEKEDFSNQNFKIILEKNENSIKELSLNYQCVQDIGIKTLESLCKDLPNLESLCISGRSFIKDRERVKQIFTIENMLELRSDLPQKTKLFFALSGTQWKELVKNDENISLICDNVSDNFTIVKERLSFFAEDSDNTVGLLQHLARVEHVCLSKNVLTSQHFNTFLTKNADTLVNLSLDGDWIGDQEMKTFAKAIKTLPKNKLEALSVSKTKNDPTWLKTMMQDIFPHLPSLYMLFLNDNNFGPDQVENLVSIVNALPENEHKYLRFSNNNLDADSLDKLKNACDKRNIYFQL